MEIGIDGTAAVAITNACWKRRALDHLIGERDTDSVVALLLDGLENGFIVLRSQPAWNRTRGLKAVPVKAGDPDRSVVDVNYLVSARMPVPGALGKRN